MHNPAKTQIGKTQPADHFVLHVIMLQRNKPNVLLRCQVLIIVVGVVRKVNNIHPLVHIGFPLYTHYSPYHISYSEIQEYEASKINPV